MFVETRIAWVDRMCKGKGFHIGTPEELAITTDSRKNFHFDCSKTTKLNITAAVQMKPCPAPSFSTCSPNFCMPSNIVRKGQPSQQ